MTTPSMSNPMDLAVLRTKIVDQEIEVRAFIQLAEEATNRYTANEYRRWASAHQAVLDSLYMELRAQSRDI